jgi:hypothetical protein
MKITPTAFSLFAVTALAFAAGRSGVFNTESTAIAAPQESKPGILEGIRDAAKGAAKAVTDPLQGKDGAPQSADPMATPGEHHAALEPAFVVRFRMSADAQWVNSTGTVSREWVLGKRFVHETVDAKSDMGPFTGIGYIGYNNLDGQYEMIWMEDTSTAMFMHAATFDPDKKVMSSLVTHRDSASGKLVHGRQAWSLANPDHQTVDGYTIGSDGREYKSFEGTFDRKK